jgi:hypothetical protein
MTSQDVEGQENPDNQGENQEGAQLGSQVTRQCIEFDTGNRLVRVVFSYELE